MPHPSRRWPPARSSRPPRSSVSRKSRERREDLEETTTPRRLCGGGARAEGPLAGGGGRGSRRRALCRLVGVAREGLRRARSRFIGWGRGGGAPEGAHLGGGHGGNRRRLPEISGDALQLMAELLKIFVVEAAIRSVRQAQAEDLAQVDVEQLEKVLPQLLLDF
ncbi:centromere protein X isoform X1 [Pseudorca crassidens]|uniref:centromere protein X isoform X1 n=1 Tax=Pseudorca crassidens TaxID=82174 RepID=UPI00352DBECA